MLKVWNKQDDINGILAEDYLESNPLMKNATDILLITDDKTGVVQQVLNVDILKSNLNLDNSLTSLEVGEAYLKTLENQNNNSNTQPETNSTTDSQIALALKSVEPTIEVIKALCSMKAITNTDVYNYVVNGKITTSDYKTITSEDCPELSLETIKQIKMNELNKICNETIINGFYSDADGTSKLYDFELENQVNISTKSYQIQIAKLSGQSITTVSYYAKGEVCHDYTTDQFLKLAQDGEDWKTSNIVKYKDELKPKVEACTTNEQVLAITW